MPSTLAEIQKAYNLLVGGIDEKAHAEDEEGNRAYGGAIRAAKGALVERIAQLLVEIAWDEMGCEPGRLDFRREVVRVPLKTEYLRRVRPQAVADYIRAHIGNYFYGLRADVHVNVDGRFVMGIECKAYTENAMLKRVLVDFTLLRQVVPELRCVLLQLESQLTGDYSEPLKDVCYGSPSTHTLLSYFDVDLKIITLLEGERRIDKPIHKQGCFKELTEPALRKAVDTFKELLGDFAN